MDAKLEITKMYENENEKKNVKIASGQIYDFGLMLVYYYGYIRYFLNKLVGKNNIMYCEKCKNFFYSDAMAFYHDYNLCPSCVTKCCRQISSIQYDDEEDRNFKSFVSGK
jgi:formylmethanofuran dehydrogenase subunit E